MNTVISNAVFIISDLLLLVNLILIANLLIWKNLNPVGLNRSPYRLFMEVIL